MDFILGANSKEQRERLTAGLVKLPRITPQHRSVWEAQSAAPDAGGLTEPADGSGHGYGYSVFEQSLLRYIAAGLGVCMSNFPGITPR